MGSISAETLHRSLERGGRGGVFLIQGEEEFLKDQAVQALVRAHLDPATRDFNYDLLRGQGLDPETLVSVCQTPPMLADWRVVLVRDAQYLSANARLRAAVESLLARPVPGLALILETSTGDVSTSQFQKKLGQAATTVTFAGLSADDVPGWLMEHAAEAGVELEPAAARAMASLTGSGLGVLTQELAKLIDFVGDRRRIRAADVQQVVGEIPRQDRWAWFDLVGDARFAEARAGLPLLLDGSETGVGLVIGLGTHMLRIGLAIAGGDRALEAVLPKNQRWLAGKYKRQARKWTDGTIETAIADLLRADRLLKSASLDERIVMDEVLLRMQNARAA